MGILDSVFGGSSVNINQNKASCAQPGCSRSAADDYEEEGVLWVCVNCLDIYCTQHIDSLFFYEPHFGVSNVSLSSSIIDSLRVNAEIEEIEEEGVRKWYEDLEGLGIDPSRWGPPSRLNYRGRKDGYVICSKCTDDIKNLDRRDNFDNLSRVYGSWPGDNIKPNFLSSAKVNDDVFISRFEERYS